MPLLDVGKQVRSCVAPHDDALQRCGKKVFAVAHVETVSLEFCDAAIDTKRHCGLCKIHSVARRATAHLRAAFAENCPQFRQRRRLTPKWHPHFTACLYFVRTRRTGVADARLAHAKWIYERTVVRAFQS